MFCAIQVNTTLHVEVDGYCRFSFAAGNQQVDAIHVTQLERDTVLVCLDRKYSFLMCSFTHHHQLFVQPM